MKKVIEQLEKMHIEHLKSWGAIVEVTKSLTEVFSDKIIEKYREKQITKKGVLYSFKHALTNILYEDYKWHISVKLLFVVEGLDRDFKTIIERNFKESHYYTEYEEHLIKHFISLCYHLTLTEFLNEDINFSFALHED